MQTWHKSHIRISKFGKISSKKHDIMFCPRWGIWEINYTALVFKAPMCDNNLPWLYGGWGAEVAMDPSRRLGYMLPGSVRRSRAPCEAAKQDRENPIS